MPVLKKPLTAAFTLALAVPLGTVCGCVSSKITEQTAASEQQSFIYQPETDAVSFNEIWGYVMIGREKQFSPDMPVSDIGYFVNAIGLYSDVLPVAPRNQYFEDYKGRVHVVTSINSKSQAHLLLDPKLPLREKIISGLVESCKTYEGLQVDWEVIPEKDADNFISFLKEIKERLNGKIFSVAVRARIKTLQNDPFDYARIAEIADRMIIMAYDEHWSTSTPGAIASYAWCKKIVDYTVSVVPKGKIVMGLPFYGRTWASYDDINKAFSMKHIERIKQENSIHHADIKRENGIPYFTYEHKTDVTVWYNDAISIHTLCQLYKDTGIPSVSFWLIGQEDRTVWQELRLSESQN